MLRLLIIEDDVDLASNISEYFEAREAELDFAYDGATALTIAQQGRFDVIVLDLGLPRLDGVGVAIRLRAAGVDVPILVLTARDSLDDKASAYGAGVDDYLVKPFALAELEMRIDALNRRRSASGRLSVLRVADLEFDTGTKVVKRAGRVLRLNRNQMTLLLHLMRESPNVISKQDLATQLWRDDTGSSDTLRAYVFELRRIVDKPFEQPLIHTVHSQGYALRASADGNE